MARESKREGTRESSYGKKPIKGGDGVRVARAEREVQANINEFLASTYKGELPAFMTVVRVKMGSDLRTARVHISFLQTTPEEEKQGLILLQRRAPEVQRYIGDRMPMRYCPKLTFEIDRSTDQIIRIEKILRDIGETNAASEADPKPENEE